MKPIHITIILPTYNEAENIIPLITSIQKYTPKGTEIIVVDDHSPDDTALRVQQHIDARRLASSIRLMVRFVNRGLTNSLKDGIAKAKGDIILWMDCDFSHPPAILPSLLHAIKQGADIAIASRMNNVGFSRILNNVMMLLFGRDISDYSTGFLGARRLVFQRIPLRGNYGEYCIDFLVRAQHLGYHIAEVPYTSPPRLYGYSKTAPNATTFVRHGLGYLLTLGRLIAYSI